MNSSNRNDDITNFKVKCPTTGKCPNETLCNKETGYCDSKLWKEQDTRNKSRTLNQMFKTRSNSKTRFSPNTTRRRTRKVSIENNNSIQQDSRNVSYDKRTKKNHNPVSKKTLKWKKSNSIHNALNNITTHSTSLLYPYTGFNIQRRILLWHLMKTNKNRVCIALDEFGYDFKTDELETPNLYALTNEMYNCIQNNKLYIIELTVYYESGSSHSNSVIINPFRKEIERFEPHIYRDRQIVIDEKIMDIIMEIPFLKNGGYKYISPVTGGCPIGLQSFDTLKIIDKQTFKHGKKEVDIETKRGHCVVWNFLYCDLRVKFPKLSQQNIQSECLHYLSQNSNVLLEFINGRIHQINDYMRENHPDMDIDQVFMLLYKYSYNKKNNIQDFYKIRDSQKYKKIDSMINNDLLINNRMDTITKTTDNEMRHSLYKYSNIGFISHDNLHKKGKAKKKVSSKKVKRQRNP